MIRWLQSRVRPCHTGPIDESTQDCKRLLAQEKQKLRRAETFAAELAAHDRVNNYALRLRRAYVLSEGGNT